VPFELPRLVATICKKHQLFPAVPYFGAFTILFAFNYKNSKTVMFVL
jgi:hypothetical protein